MDGGCWAAQLGGTYASAGRHTHLKCCWLAQLPHCLLPRPRSPAAGDWPGLWQCGHDPGQRQEGLPLRAAQLAHHDLPAAHEPVRWSGVCRHYRCCWPPGGFVPDWSQHVCPALRSFGTTSNVMIKANELENATQVRRHPAAAGSPPAAGCACAHMLLPCSWAGTRLPLTRHWHHCLVAATRCACLSADLLPTALPACPACLPADIR